MRRAAVALLLPVSLACCGLYGDPEGSYVCEDGRNIVVDDYAAAVEGTLLTVDGMAFRLREYKKVGDVEYITGDTFVLAASYEPEYRNRVYLYDRRPDGQVLDPDGVECSTFY